MKSSEGEGGRGEGRGGGDHTSIAPQGTPAKGFSKAHNALEETQNATF